MLKDLFIFTNSTSFNQRSLLKWSLMYHKRTKQWLNKYQKQLKEQGSKWKKNLKIQKIHQLFNQKETPCLILSLNRSHET